MVLRSKDTGRACQSNTRCRIFYDGLNKTDEIQWYYYRCGYVFRAEFCDLQRGYLAKGGSGANDSCRRGPDRSDQCGPYDTTSSLPRYVKKMSPRLVNEDSGNGKCGRAIICAQLGHLQRQDQPDKRSGAGRSTVVRRPVSKKKRAFLKKHEDTRDGHCCRAVFHSQLGHL